MLFIVLESKYCTYRTNEHTYKNENVKIGILMPTRANYYYHTLHMRFWTTFLNKINKNELIT